MLQLLCIIVQDEGDISAFKDYVPTAADDSPVGGKTEAAPPSAPAPPPPPPTPVTAAPTTPRPVTPSPAPTTPAPAVSAPGGRIFASPYARTLAAEKGVDLSVSGFS